MKEPGMEQEHRRGQEHGKGRSLGSYILTHGMGKEPGMVQEPGRSNDLGGVGVERPKTVSLKGNKGRSMGF